MHALSKATLVQAMVMVYIQDNSMNISTCIEDFCRTGKSTLVRAWLNKMKYP